MKATQDLKARLGANMRESVGPYRPDAPGAVPPPAVAFQGIPEERGAYRNKNSLTLELDRIAPDPNQPRKEFEQKKLEDLAESLRSQGQLQAISVSYDPETDIYVIEDGERRWRAAKIAGLPMLDTVVDKVPRTALERLARQLAANLHRDDLKPIDRAKTYRKLIDGHGWSYRDLAESQNISLASISDDLKLLGLPEDLQAKVDSGELPKSSASAIADMPDEAAQRELANRAMSGEANRQTVKDEAKRARSTVKQGKAEGTEKGRGAKAQASKNQGPLKIRQFKSTEGVKVTVERGKSMNLSEILLALVEFTTLVQAECDDELYGPKPVKLDPRKILWGSIDQGGLPEAEVASVRERIESKLLVETPTAMYDGTSHWLAGGAVTLAAVLSMSQVPRTTPVFVKMGGQADAERHLERQREALAIV